MYPTSELDKFIRRVQVKSMRVALDGKILRIEPSPQEKVRFDLTPSKYAYENCCIVHCARYPAIGCKAAT